MCIINEEADAYLAYEYALGKRGRHSEYRFREKGPLQGMPDLKHEGEVRDTAALTKAIEDQYKIRVISGLQAHKDAGISRSSDDLTNQAQPAPAMSVLDLVKLAGRLAAVVYLLIAFTFRSRIGRVDPELDIIVLDRHLDDSGKCYCPGGLLPPL